MLHTPFCSSMQFVIHLNHCFHISHGKQWMFYWWRILMQKCFDLGIQIVHVAQVYDFACSILNEVLWQTIFTAGKIGQSSGRLPPKKGASQVHGRRGGNKKWSSFKRTSATICGIGFTQVSHLAHVACTMSLMRGTKPAYSIAIGLESEATGNHLGQVCLLRSSPANRHWKDGDSSLIT